MKAQEIFDTVLTKLREQGKASMDGGLCFYRNYDGSCCAVGHLLTDEEYDAAWEGKTVAGLINEGYGDKPFPQRLSDHPDLLMSLQLAHDSHLGEYGMESWEERMEDIAIEHGLNYQEVGNVVD